MKKLFLPLILFLLLIFEGGALEFLPAKIVSGNLYFIPHWVFLFLLLIAIFYDKENTGYAIIYAILFGLLIDIVYTGVLGVYMFSYALVIYFVHELRRVVLTNFYVVTILSIVMMILVELCIYLIYSVIGIADLAWMDYLIYRLFPTVTANIVFLLVFYPLSRKFLTKWSEEQLHGKNTF